MENKAHFVPLIRPLKVQYSGQTALYQPRDENNFLIAAWSLSESTTVEVGHTSLMLLWHVNTEIASQMYNMP